MPARGVGDTHALCHFSGGKTHEMQTMINGYSPIWTMVRFEFDVTPEGRKAARTFRRKFRSSGAWPWPATRRIAENAYHLVPATADDLEKRLRPMLPAGTYSRLDLIPITDKQVEVPRTFYKPAEKETKQ